ncbi:hypothetical protein IAD21_05735 [Abditibacteriota bacterium]|nr:hypothetical protein IAD21_05735 [Abditibacteriota bacterium]
MKKRAAQATRFFMQLFYELSPDDMAAAQSLFWRRRRPLLFWGFTIYGVLFFLFGLWQLFRGSLGSALVPLLFGVWATLFVPMMLPRAAKKNWKKSPFLHGATTLTTSNEGLETANPVWRSFMRWEVVGDILEGPTVWLVLVGPMNFHIIPARAFSSDAERIQFRNEAYPRGSAASGQTPIAAP